MFKDLNDISLSDESICFVLQKRCSSLNCFLLILLKWVVNQSDLCVMSPYFKNVSYVFLFCHPIIQSTHALCLMMTNPHIFAELHNFYVNGYPIIANDSKNRVTRSNNRKGYKIIIYIILF